MNEGDKTMTTETKQEKDTFAVIVDRLDDLYAKIAKINKRAAKLGCPEILLVKVGEPFQDSATTKYDGQLTSIKVMRQKVRVIGDAPCVEGWEFIAKLQHIEGVVIVSAVPGESVPVEFREVKSGRCDHCNTNRKRLDTFLLRNEETGAWKVVGRNCLCDFLGGHDPKTAAAYCKYLIEVRNVVEQESSLFGQCDPQYFMFGLEDVLTRTVVVIREEGWVSRKEAKNSYAPKYSTSDIVVEDILSRDPKEKDVFAKKATKEDKEEALAALEWARDLDPGTNDYLYNIKTIANLGAARMNLMGYACSILPAYRRETGYKAEQEKAKAESDWIGQIKKREVYEFTVVGMSTTQGYYGTTFIYRFIEGSGNRVTWFSSKNAELKTGETYKVKATVKKHDTYKGMKQTIVTRCAVV